MRSGSRLLPENTVLFTSRAPIGYVAIAKNKIATNQGFKSIICDEKKCHYLYLYYFLKSNLSYIKLFGSGSTFPEISGSVMKKIKINIFADVAKQNKIASILSSYDDLIEKNNRKIAILQQMAEELYKEWFVRFRFPGHKTAKFKDGIPEGWKIERIGNMYSTTSGGTPNRSHNEYYEGGTIPWVKTGELLNNFIIDTEERITTQGLENSSAKLIAPGSLLCSMYAGVGKLGFAAIELTCSQATCVFTPKTYCSNNFLFFFLKFNKDYLENISFGAAQQNISQEIIKKIKFTVPTDNLIDKFDEFVKPIFKAILFIQYQNKNLIMQRDLLLPRLMSGKLKVKA